MPSLLTITIANEQDIVLARQRTRQVATLLGLPLQDQTRLSTAVSELSRNALHYAQGGRIEFFIEDEKNAMLWVTITDSGPGIKNLKSILDGQYVSLTGMGLGIIGAKRLSDKFSIETSPTGTRVTIGKIIPKNLAGQYPATATIVFELARQQPTGAFYELQRQNQELMQALADLYQRQNEIERLNKELAETNRGVVALYAELDEKAAALQRVSGQKSRFLSNISHEFRTPLSSIRNLTRVLLDRMDGDLTQEQVRQVTYIKSMAETLSELVNDLLDIAKIESGKIDVKPREFEVGEMFAILRGVFRPMVDANAVALIFEEPLTIQRKVHSDEGKVAQVMRNLISNSIKFTKAGEIRISASMIDDQWIEFVVKDTGIGIAPEDHERIFQEYTQIDSPIQQTVKGTGLGLPLSRKLAGLLGGELKVRSAGGSGSEFILRIPMVFVGSLTQAKDELASTGQFETESSHV